MVGPDRTGSLGPGAVERQAEVAAADGSERAYLATRALTCANVVELRGFEPLTYSMRTSRATNCAIAPDR
jgi:hypothetical protein